LIDIRTLKPIMEWNISIPNKSGSGIICSSQFNFDETSVYVVDESGEVNHIFNTEIFIVQSINPKYSK